MLNFACKFLNLFVLRLDTRLKCALSCDKLGVLRGDLVDFGRLVLILIELGLEQLDLPVFILYHLLLALDIILTIGVLLGLGLGTLELIEEPLLVFLAPHEAHMQVVLLYSLLIQNVLLLVEGLLEPRLVFFEAVGVLLTH